MRNLRDLAVIYYKASDYVTDPMLGFRDKFLKVGRDSIVSITERNNIMRRPFLSQSLYYVTRGMTIIEYRNQFTCAQQHILSKLKG